MNNVEVTSTEHYNQYDFPLGSNNNLKEFRHRTDLNAAPAKRTLATHSDDDRLLTLRGSVNRDYTYTADGDLETMTNCYGETRYEYDIFSNLKKVTLPTGQVIEYKVDGLNRRVKKLLNGNVVEYYLWYDQTRIAAVLDANKQTKLVYLYGPDSTHSPSYVIKEGVSYRILHDPGLGSIRYIVNPATREIVQEIEYDEYGNMMKNTNASFQPLTYAGGLYDSDTKLIRFGARDYDPTVGRWTTKDPIGFAGGDTNLYGYVQGNPMSLTDPEGKNPFIIGGAIVGGIVGGVGGFLNSTGCTGSQRFASSFYGALGGAVGGAVVGLTGGALAPNAFSTIGAIGFDAGASALGAFAGYNCTPPPPPPPCPLK